MCLSLLEDILRVGGWLLVLDPCDDILPRVMVDIYRQGALRGDERVEHLRHGLLELGSVAVPHHVFQLLGCPPETGTLVH